MKEGNPINKDKAHQIQVKANELRNTKLMIEKNNKEIEELRTRINLLTGSSMLLEMEDAIRHSESTKIEWLKKIREVE